MTRMLMVLGMAAAACGGSNTGNGGDGGIVVGDGGGQSGPFDLAGCTNLRCKIETCTGGGTTTLTGVVNIPAGNLPLYGATVYVPNLSLTPLAHGATCDRCDTPLSGDPITRTTTDTAGKFELRDVPSGADIPLVIQAGKWRRRITIPSVESCTENKVADGSTRLPRDQTEGDLPQIAVTTGGADAIECLLRKLGIADREFTPETGSGRVHLYAGTDGAARYRANMNGGASFTAAPTFWNSLDNLKKYDVIVHSCEGTEAPTNKSAQALGYMRDYANMGGRVFMSHWHNYWVEHGPDPLPTVAKFNHRADLTNPIVADIDTSFEKGGRFADWMVNVGGSPPMMRGKVEVRAAQNTIESVNAQVAQRWMSIPSENNIQYLSFNTPVGSLPDAQCGRMVLTDIHVSSGDTSNGTQFPDGCTSTTLTAQEKALIFILFDLANCLDVPIG